MPANRHKTGFRGPSPDVGKATQFKPGQSGNPAGRPKKPLTEAYTELAFEIFPGDKKRRTFARLVAEAQFNQAIKGKTDAAREIADRIQGKPTQEITGTDGDPIPLTVEGIDEAILKIIRAAEERQAKGEGGVP